MALCGDPPKSGPLVRSAWAAARAPDRFGRRPPTGAIGHRAARCPRVHPVRQRPGVHRQGTPALAGRAEDQDHLHHAGEPVGERLRRIIPLPLPRRMPQPRAALDPDRRAVSSSKTSASNTTPSGRTARSAISLRNASARENLYQSQAPDRTAKPVRPSAWDCQPPPQSSHQITRGLTFHLAQFSGPAQEGPHLLDRCDGHIASVK